MSWEGQRPQVSKWSGKFEQRCVSHVHKWRTCEEVPRWQCLQNKKEEGRRRQKNSLFWVGSWEIRLVHVSQFFPLAPRIALIWSVRQQIHVRHCAWLWGFSNIIHKAHFLRAGGRKQPYQHRAIMQHDIRSPFSLQNSQDREETTCKPRPEEWLG